MNKMKKLSKKGFTLVELLAVIVVLAILVLLAMPRVTSMMEKARQNSFTVEANEIQKVAQTVYNDHLLSGTDDAKNGVACYTVDELIDGGYLDKDKGEVVGAVILEIPSSGAPTVHMYLSKGKYYIKNLTTKAKATNVNTGTNNLYSACNVANVKCGTTPSTNGTTISTLGN